MRIVDPHVHMYSRTTDDYERMGLAGIEFVVEPSFWLGSMRTGLSTYRDYFDHILDFEPGRAAQYGIQHYACIAMNPKEANNLDLAMDVVESLEPYLAHPRCVALGEVGFDRITDAEEEVLRAQLRLARRQGIPVMVHLPHQNKPEGIRRTLQCLREEGLPPGRILIDHNTEETLEQALAYGAWAGMTIYPTKMSPERAIALINRYGVERVMLNSAADWGPSGPLSVPLTARAMIAAGFSRGQVEQVVWHNPLMFYRQSGRLEELS
jgi:predicted metal-dependent TIM-barrel fold hydrolase